MAKVEAEKDQKEEIETSGHGGESRICGICGNVKCCLRVLRH